MKNLHIVPTEKASRLGYLTKKGKEVFNDLRLFEKPMPNILDSENQNIYITSDEEIKVGDYFIESLGLPDSYLVHKLSKEWKDKESFYRRCTKVILTTDADLIEDRVESIDDEFLEWFVKNPSCEEVEVHELRFFDPDTNESGHCKWELIIPKEESKQFVECKCTNSLQAENCIRNCGHGKEPCDNCGNEICCCILKKQETLEEFALKNSKYINHSNINHSKQEAIILGAKWQQERMYSEEEVKHIVSEALQSQLVGYDYLEQWFTQFKKK